VSAKSLTIISIFLGLAVISAGSVLIFQKTGISLGQISKASASVIESVAGIFRAEQDTQDDQGEKKIEKKVAGEQDFSQNQLNQINGLSDKLTDADTETQENLTQRLSLALAKTAYITNFDPAGAEDPDLINQAFEKADIDPEKIFALPEISDEEIKISDDNSKINIQLYISKMTRALSYGALPIEYFEELQTKGLENIDPEDLPKIEQLISDYRKSIDEVKQIEAPSTWKEIHKEQLGILILTENLLKAILSQDNDPLKAGLALEKIYQVSDLMESITEKILSLSQEQQIFSEYQ